MLTQITQVCESASQQGAEDVFLTAGEFPRLRLVGQLVLLKPSGLVSPQEMAHFWEVCGADPVTLQEFDATWKSPSGARFRVNLFRQLGVLAAALRPVKTEIPELETLGVPVERLQSWGSASGGLVLLAGGTGSGKSTTIASLLNWINHQRALHIVTIEDPIEYLIPSAQSFVTQRGIGTDTESFASGLRSALRQSPDVILVGEIRDTETARIALQASETGHLVLATLHSVNVSETFDRLMSLFPAPERQSALMVLGSQLVGILSQKLLPTVDGRLCLVTEHLENSGAVRRWASRGEFDQISEFMERDTDRGNQRFVDSVMERFDHGLITEEIARQSCSNPLEFDQRRAGVRRGSR